MAFLEQAKNAEKSKEKEAWCETFANYMHGRLTKLDQQLQQHCMDAAANNETELSLIFQGVAVHIDGYTEPSSDVLREMVVGAGGKSVHWFSKTNVTHVIATSLARSKILNWGDGVKVVRPEWIVESCKTNRLLPWQDFRLFPDSNENKNTIENAFQQQQQTRTGTSPRTKKAGDDGFISDFYGNSRLHHLSDWRVKLKNFVAERKKENSGNIFPRLDDLMACVDVFEHTASQTETSLIMHIDLDCFFVSAGLLSRPQLVGQPVVVTHNTGRKTSPTKVSYSEIASCSYEARAMGIRNGMLLGHAEKLCSSLVHIPYEFDKYDEISHKFYEVLLGFTNDIEPVSCDEAYVDLKSILKTASGKLTTAEIVTAIRNGIFDATSCRCSAGIGKNRLVARLCTKRAKPNGQFILDENYKESFDEFIGKQEIADLPGVGHVMISKLHGNFGENITTCAEMQELPLDHLVNVFGPRTGQFLYDSCRGICREAGLKAPETRKSVSAEINYGMRFNDPSEVKKFLSELVDEVVKRLNEAGVKGQQLHLKLRLRSQDAPRETKKFLGHGVSDAFTKSTFLNAPCNTSPPILAACTKLLFGSNGNGIGEFGKFDVADVRGMGIQFTKLVDTTAPPPDKSNLMKAFAKAGVKRPRPPEQVAAAANVTPRVSPPKSLRRQAQVSKAIPRPSLIGVSTLPEVCSLIDEWFSASPSPCAEDLEMMVTYFNSVIDYGDLGHVYDVLRFMRKKLQPSASNNLWLNSFEQVILISVKQKVKTVYGLGAEIPTI